MLRGIAEGVLIHQSEFGRADEVSVRIDQDRAYVHALSDARDSNDPRFSDPYCKDWLPSVHAQQIQNLAARRERDGTPRLTIVSPNPLSEVTVNPFAGRFTSHRGCPRRCSKFALVSFRMHRLGS